MSPALQSTLSVLECFSYVFVFTIFSSAIAFLFSLLTSKKYSYDNETWGYIARQFICGLQNGKGIKLLVRVNHHPWTTDFVFVNLSKM